MRRQPGRWKVWFHRSRAVVWLIVGALSFPLGWADSVVLVWIASLYANVFTDLGAAEAADDRAVIERLDQHDERFDRVEKLLVELRELHAPDPADRTQEVSTMAVRAKFRCNSVTFNGDPADANTSRSYTLTPVYDTSTPENARFTKATPWGELKLNVDNPAARFEVGQFYYVDFTPTEPAEPGTGTEPGEPGTTTAR